MLIFKKKMVAEYCFKRFMTVFEEKFDIIDLKNRNLSLFHCRSLHLAYPDYFFLKYMSLISYS